MTWIIETDTPVHQKDNPVMAALLRRGDEIVMASVASVEHLTDAELTAEVRRRGFSVSERPEITRRYVLERAAGDDWDPTGAWLIGTAERTPEGVLARWLEHTHVLTPGVYRCAVYQGPELVGASEPTEIVG